MNPTVRNIVAVIAGIAAGILIMTIILTISMALSGLPEGVTINTTEELDAFARTASIGWFIGPFLAHLIGTLAGAFICSKIAVGQWLALAMAVGVFFLIGGVIQRVDMYHPLIITILDIGGYLPMAWLGWKLAGGKR